MFLCRFCVISMEKGISCLDIIAVCDVSVDSTVHLRDFPMCWKSLLVMSSLCVESLWNFLEKGISCQWSLHFLCRGDVSVEFPCMMDLTVCGIIVSCGVSCPKGLCWLSKKISSHDGVGDHRKKISSHDEKFSPHDGVGDHRQKFHLKMKNCHLMMALARFRWFSTLHVGGYFRFWFTFSRRWWPGPVNFLWVNRGASWEYSP